MYKPKLRERLAYAFDSSLAGGPVVLIAWLALVSLVVIVALSALVWLTGIAPSADSGTSPGFVAIAWMALMRTLDAGTMGGDQGSWSYLLAMLAVTFAGIFVISTFIGTLTSAIDEKLAALRKGRSRVLESGHTVILGWSPRVFSIVQELIVANESRRGAAVVVLGDLDKVEMEDALRERIPERKGTKVICRSGLASDMAALEIVNIQGSKSVMILPEQGPEADLGTIKTLLAITNSPSRRSEPYHIVAEMREAQNFEVAKLVGRDEVELVLVPDLLARVTVQTCRQPGLSVVYQELLDFGGDEIYFAADPRLVGQQLGEVLNRYEASAVIGVCAADGTSRLLPPLDTVLLAGDQIIAISADDDTVVLKGSAPSLDEGAIVAGAVRAARPEHTLVLGWNSKVPLLLRELEAYVAPGSEVRIVADFPGGVDEARDLCPSTTKQRVSLFTGDPTQRQVLEGLELSVFDHVILLSGEGLEVEQADARTLMTLLHLRDLREGGSQAGMPLSIVSEMLDVRNRALAEVTRADDFIVGDQLVSLLLTQIAENKKLNAVFTDIFDPEGAEIYLKPAADYVALDREVNVATLVESARRRNEMLIGYRLRRHSRDKDKAYGIVTNPTKSSRVRFAEGDSVIVLAND
jgi:Trk K+ transport system NAD-binding subunit